MGVIGLFTLPPSMLVLAIWSLYPSNWIFQCPEWLTPMRRLDSRAKASLHSSLPPKNRAETSNGLAIRPLDGLLYKPANTTRDIARFFLLF